MPSASASQIVLMVRDPETLYIHWTLENEDLQRHGLDRRVGRPLLMLRLAAADGPITGGFVQEWVVGIETRDHTLRIPRGERHWSVELGYVDRDGRFRTIARSNRVISPHGQPAELPHEARVTRRAVPDWVTGQPRSPAPAPRHADVRLAAEDSRPTARPPEGLPEWLAEIPPPQPTGPDPSTPTPAATTTADDTAHRPGAHPASQRVQGAQAKDVAPAPVDALGAPLPQVAASQPRLGFAAPAGPSGAPRAEAPALDHVAQASGAGFHGAGQSAALPVDAFRLSVDADLTVYGATEPDARLTVQGRPITLRPDGTFTLRFSLPEGEQVIDVVATSTDGRHTRTVTLIIRRATL
ncbi:MAG TPA: DUF4912 domain-containing protein [Candidatus Sumerlaeota bacterium]|nr:DUF4912 domain-containing protein [Candidatus Sumerlaeota bacterium]